MSAPPADALSVLWGTQPPRAVRLPRLEAQLAALAVAPVEGVEERLAGDTGEAVCSGDLGR